MKAPLPRIRPESCLSDFALDRRLAGELDDDEEAKARAHLDGCTRCMRRFDELTHERERFMTEPLPPRLRAQMERRPVYPSRPLHSASRGRLLAAAGALAMAAALLFVFRFHLLLSLEGTRTKGSSVEVGFYVKHGDSVRLGTSGERVAPGDAIRFVYTTPSSGHLAVLSVDGARRASIYYPSSATSAPAPGGDGIALPVSTILDDTLGAETIYAVFCPEPFALEPLRAAIEASPDRIPMPAGCAVEKMTLHKDVSSEEVSPSP